jgi:hypothetical protein
MVCALSRFAGVDPAECDAVLRETRNRMMPFLGGEVKPSAP